jgi:hypothetical protein
MTYDYKDGATVAKEIPPEIEWYREYFKRTGASK